MGTASNSDAHYLISAVANGGVQQSLTKKEDRDRCRAAKSSDEVEGEAHIQLTAWWASAMRKRRKKRITSCDRRIRLYNMFHELDDMRPKP